MPLRPRPGSYNGFYLLRKSGKYAFGLATCSREVVETKNAVFGYGYTSGGAGYLVASGVIEPFHLAGVLPRLGVVPGIEAPKSDYKAVFGIIGHKVIFSEFRV